MKNRPMLTLDDCRRISAAAEAEAAKNNWAVCVAILDDGGHLLHLVRMDGATPANAEIAVLKARTAALTRRSSKMWEDRVASGRLAMLTVRVRIVWKSFEYVLTPVKLNGVMLLLMRYSSSSGSSDRRRAT